MNTRTISDLQKFMLSSVYIQLLKYLKILKANNEWQYFRVLLHEGFCTASAVFMNLKGMLGDINIHVMLTKRTAGYQSPAIAQYGSVPFSVWTC